MLIFRVVEQKVEEEMISLGCCARAAQIWGDSLFFFREPESGLEKCSQTRRLP
jgi:hypothetical protein